jgi:transposase-like protein
MQNSVLDAKHFHDEEAAYAYLEARVWPNGPICPHCGGVERISKMRGKSTRIGVYKCHQCRKPFRVTVGTVFESSHVPLRLWLQAVHLLASSKKGISSNQLHRTLGVTLKTAWFMSHRVREAMRVLGVEPMGGAGVIVESDETYIGKLDGSARGKHGASQKNAILTLVERGGSARSFHISGQAISAGHRTVKHSDDEYVRHDVWIEGDKVHFDVTTTNAVEGFFSVFKRGMKGIYQHCKEKHLHRYLAEFDFRYSNRVRLGVDDVQRADQALKGIVGKRLTYQTSRD